jgi:membrane protease YdiL (CAAX protease family)
MRQVPILREEVKGRPVKSGQAISAMVACFILILASAFLFPPKAYGSSVFYVSLSFAAAALLLASWHKGKGKALAYLGLSFRRNELPRLALYGVLLAVGCVSLTWLVSGILFAFGMLDTAPVLDKVSLLPLPVLILAFTLSPIGEEMIFRGFLFRYTESSFGPKHSKGNIAWISSALLTSLVFAVLHFGYGSVAEISVAFVMGTVLCASVKKTGSLIPAIIAHAIFNLLSVVSITFF